MDRVTRAWANMLEAEIASGVESRNFWRRMGVEPQAPKQKDPVTEAMMRDAMLALYLEVFAPPRNPMRIAVHSAMMNWQMR